MNCVDFYGLNYCRDACGVSLARSKR